MTAFENARKFFEACETAKGWAGCKQYVVEGAPFSAQSEPLMDVKTVEAYCDWMAGLGTITAPGATYDLHVSCFDEAARTAVPGLYVLTRQADRSYTVRWEGTGPTPPLPERAWGCWKTTRSTRTTRIRA